MEEIVYHVNYRLEDTYWWFIARRQIVLKLIRKFCRLDSQESILDFGCGTGGFMKSG